MYGRVCWCFLRVTCVTCGTQHAVRTTYHTYNCFTLVDSCMHTLLVLLYFFTWILVLSVYVFSPIFQLTTHVPLHCVVSFSLSTVSTFASVTGIGGAATAVLDGLISIGGLVS